MYKLTEFKVFLVIKSIQTLVSIWSEKYDKFYFDDITQWSFRVILNNRLIIVNKENVRTKTLA